MNCHKYNLSLTPNLFAWKYLLIFLYRPVIPFSLWCDINIHLLLLFFDGVTTCPLAGAQEGLSHGPRVRLLLKENAWSRHQHLFEENVEKTKMEKVEGLCILKIRVRELFTHREGISTPRTRHKGRKPLIKCANHDFKTVYFPFLSYLFPFLCFYLVFLFWIFTSE